MRTYRFFDEGSNETLATIHRHRELNSIEIEMYINKLENVTGCYVLWEEIV
jgi:hypothetical protein